MDVLYNPIKANVVSDALSHMTMGSVPHVEEDRKDLVKDGHRFSRLGLRLEDLQIVVLSFTITPNHLW